MKNIIRRWFITVILIFFFESVIAVLESNAEEKLSKNMKLLYQELLFNVPTDIFLILEIDVKAGSCILNSRINYEKAIALYGNNINLTDKEINKDKVFVLWEADNSNYYLILRRSFNINKKKADYSIALVDSVKKFFLKEFLGEMEWAVDRNKLYFIEKKFEFAMFDLAENKTSILMKDISAFIKYPQKDSFIIFTSDGNIRQVEENKDDKLLKYIGGVITEAGLIDEMWGWFYRRRSERTTGNFYLINLHTKKIHKIKDEIPHCKFIKKISY